MNQTHESRSLWSKKKRNALSLGLLATLFLFATPMVRANLDLESSANERLQTEVTGTVTDAAGEPLPGANVLVKSTTTGTQTDFDGNYSIMADSDAVLVFSYVGFRSVEVSVDGQTTIDVSMEEDAADLDEVVVTGYSTQTRGDLTGSVASVDISEATKAPIVNAAEALEGRVTGVTVINDGQPGSSPIVRIRGFGSPNGNNPLYIIDGVQTDDASILNSLNSADIEQMNVLKDGAAAIYGARASNGVVVITTKSGGYNMDKPSVAVDLYSGLARATNIPELLNVEQHGDMIFESLINDGVSVEHPQYGSGPQPVVPDQLRGTPVNATVNPNGTDWLDAIFRSALTQNFSATLQNGTNSGKYLMSVGFLSRDGVLLETGFKRGTSRLNSEFKISDKIRIGEHLNLSFTNTASSNSQGIITDAFKSSPLIPVRDDNGDFAGTYSNSLGLSNSRNPVAQLVRGGDDFAKALRIFGDVYASIELLEGVTVKTSFGGDVQAFNDRRFLALDPEHGEPRAVNQLNEQDFDSYQWVWTNTVNLNKSFGDHTLNAVVGVEALQSRTKGKEVARTDFLFETPEFYLLSNGAGAPNVLFAYDNSNTLFSVFGTANYSYAGKYLLTATVRRDQSSRFLGDNQSDIFPSFSAGWVVSDEDFFPDGAVSRLKLKASWGQLGNQSLPADNPTQNISIISEEFGNYDFSGSGGATSGAILNQVGNPDLRWETSETTNFGLELGLLDNKIAFSFEYFNIETKDLISRDNSQISTTAIDAQAPLVNLGSFENTGFDVSLGIQDSFESGFSYGINANLSRYENEVTELISAFQVGNADFRGGAINRTQVGQPLASFYGRVVEGFDDNGRFQYRDIDGNGAIDDGDRDFIGSPHPDFTYGLNLNLGYKNVDFSAFFSGSQGNDIYNYQKIFTDFPTFFDDNRSVRVLDSWRPNNTDATLPALSNTLTNSETNPNSYFVEDGSYLRLKNVQLGYTLPADVSDKIGMSSLRLYVQGTNLFTITGYNGLDPEIRPRIAGGSIDNLTLGVDNGIYPLSQIFTVGANIKF